MHRAAQRRVAVLQPADKQHQGFSARGDEVTAQLFAMLAHVPRERVRLGRGLFAGLAAAGKEKLRIRGHILQE